MAGEQDEKTEAATPRRLQRAHAEGQTPVSRELTALAGLAAVTLALVLAAPGVAHDLTLRLSVFLARANELAPGGSLVFRAAALAWLHAAAPFVLAAMLAGVAVVLVQTRFLLSARHLRVDVSRVSPKAGLKRLLGADSLVEAAKSVTKVVVLTAVGWRVLQADLRNLLLAPFGEPSRLLERSAGPVLRLLLVMLAAQAGIAAVDILWVHFRHARGLRMSRHDILEEMKETEGDP